MDSGLRSPVARLTAITLGVTEMKTSIAFYVSLGFERKFPDTGEDVAFFDTGGAMLALYPWHLLALDAGMADAPRPIAFRGMTLAWNCSSQVEVDAVLTFALSKGASLLKAAHVTHYGGYSGYFADPDGHPWEVVVAPGMIVGDNRLLELPA